MTISSDVTALHLDTLERAWLAEMIAGFTFAEASAVVSLQAFPDVSLFNHGDTSIDLLRK